MGGLLASLSLSTAILLSQGKSKLLGSWDATLPNGSAVVATFRASGHMVFEGKNPKLPSWRIQFKGKYSEQGPNLFLTMQTVEFINTPKEAKHMELQLRKELLRRIKAGRLQVTQMTWKGKDTCITRSPTGDIGRLTRRRK